jgi:hypothetical protein
MIKALPIKIVDAFTAQGRACFALGSPFMAAFMAEVLDCLPAGALRDRIADWPGEVGPEAASIPLRLAAGFHALALSGQASALYRQSGDWQAGLAAHIAEIAATHEDFLLRWLDHAPQTNEVGRSAILIAVAAVVARHFGLPLVLSELGASAGLNLSFDRFGLRVGDAVMGAVDSPVVLLPEWRSGLPEPQGFTVVDRRGCDLNPLDPAADGLRLMAYVWPDQPERLARLRAALTQTIAGAVDRAEAADWLENRLAELGNEGSAGRCHFVYHTVAHQYFPAATQERIAKAMADAGALASPQAPLVWFGMEADGAREGAALTLRLWPGDRLFNLGRAGFHGHWIDWRGLT